MGRLQLCDACIRLGNHGRDYLNDWYRRPHLGRRDRLSHARRRPVDRQSDLSRRRHCGRGAAHCGERENEDLFWALRGGGGNFGVVTSFEYQLHEVDQVYAGPLLYNLEDAATVLRMFDEFIRDAPEEFGGFPGFQIAPPLPFIPEDRHGDTLFLVVVHWAGSIDQAERVLQPFRDVAPIVADGTAQLPYPALNGAFDALYPKGLRAYWKGSFVKELPDAAIAAHVEHGSQVPEVTCTMHLYPINGACHRVAANDTAFAYRDATYGMVMLAGWTRPGQRH